MNKRKVLEAINRRMIDCRKFTDSTEASSVMRNRAMGALNALLNLKIEIENMDTKKRKQRLSTIHLNTFTNERTMNNENTDIHNIRKRNRYDIYYARHI